MKTLALLLSAVLVTAGLVSCGGGSGSTAITTQAVAAAGELITYTIDKTALTYSYEITGSAYGKLGETGSGTLTLNSNGFYTPSGFNGRLAIKDSGLMLGAIFEDIDGTPGDEVIPVIGLSNPLTTLADAAGTYNFVSRQCTVNIISSSVKRSTSCQSNYGTVTLDSSGNWESCKTQNLSALAPGACGIGNRAVGTISSFRANGQADFIFGGATAGTLLAFNDATTGQKVVLIDLNGASALGAGGIFAATQRSIASGDGDGVWHAITTSGSREMVTVSATNFSVVGVDSSGRAYAPSGTFTLNNPWIGFASTSSGSYALMGGAGLYAALDDPPNPSTAVGSFGIKP